MNLLYKLSKQHGQNELTIQEFRAKRRELIEAILDGGYLAQTAITNVPKVGLNETTQEHQVPKNRIEQGEDKVQDVNPSSSKAKGIWKSILLLAFLVILACGYRYKNQLMELSQTYLSSAETKVPATPTTNITKLVEYWSDIMQSSQYGEQKVNNLKNIWDKSSANQKLAFTKFLNAKLKSWKTDFDKELEVSLTLQMIKSLESTPTL